MKNRSLVMLCAGMLALSLEVNAQTATNSITVDGATYTNVTVRQAKDDPDAVVVVYAGGVFRVSIESLTDKQRSALGLPTRTVLAEQKQKEQAFAAEQIKKGFVESNGKWLAPDKLPTIESKHDDIQSVTWYHTKRETSRGKNTTYSISLYIGQDDIPVTVSESQQKQESSKDRTFFRLSTEYNDARIENRDVSWIFYKRIRLLGDNGARLDVTTEYPHKNEDNDSYGLTEWADNYITAENVLPFRGAKRIQVKFEGKYSQTFDMTAEQLRAFQEMIALYTYLSANK